MTTSYDYVIIGSGIAGLYAAILAREHGSVLVLTKGSIDDCNTRWAQGGIAAPIGAGDSPEKHLRDTIVAGAGLVDEEAARVLTSEAADRIRDLVALGRAVRHGPRRDRARHGRRALGAARSCTRAATRPACTSS